ncbi:F-box protein At5g49610-like [Elaeis guineensis]|uniref:F-box protein At5g49610-like n=1 Tax=Elaeis guineensis var. tenera TaxID=51953 RepID=A0A6I9R1L3_ELAGV|nr:F-box protein At5g49610-like [Elaeis guineensis]XP_029120169.1 F-box protein At5g49610-like [Elaeis guineensis]
MKGARVFIPHDIIFNILERLPAKSILRFRGVCKSWSSLISDPYFLLCHAHRAKPSVLLTRYTQPSLGLQLQPVRCTNTQTTTFEVRCPCLSLLASCDGLLCFQGIPFGTRRHYSPGYYYVCNPLTDEWITLPEAWCNNGFLCAFYHHSSMNEYRLLRNSPYGYEILTIGAKEWRRITCLFDANPSPMLEFYVLHGPPSLDKPPISVHGKLHYLPTIGTPLIWLIIVFDIDSEKFGLMSLPESCRTKEWTIHESRLIELEGKLGVSTIAPDAMLDIWMLEDYEKQVWVKRYRVQTTPRREQITWFKPLVVHDDGKALVDWRGDLVLYDFKHHTCRKIIIEDGFRMTNLLYKESLIRHEFFETGYQTGFIINLVSSFYLQQQTSR